MVTDDKNKTSFSDKLDTQMKKELEEIKLNPGNAIKEALKGMIIYFLVVILVLYIITRPYECKATYTNISYKTEGLKTLNENCQKSCIETDNVAIGDLGSTSRKIEREINMNCYNKCTNVKCTYEPMKIIEKEGFIRR